MATIRRKPPYGKAPDAVARAIVRVLDWVLVILAKPERPVKDLTIAWRFLHAFAFGIVWGVGALLAIWLVW